MKQAFTEKLIIFIVVFLILYYIGNPREEEQFLQAGLAEEEVGFSGDNLLAASTCFDGDAACNAARRTVEINVDDAHTRMEMEREDAIEEADNWVGDADAEEGEALWHFSNYIPLAKCDDCRGMGDIKLSQELDPDVVYNETDLDLRYHTGTTPTTADEAVQYEKEGRFTTVDLSDKEGRQDDFEPSKEWVAKMCLKDSDCLGFQINRAEGSAKLISYAPAYGVKQIKDPDNDDEATDIYFLHPYRALKWQETGQNLPYEYQNPVPRPRTHDDWRSRIQRLAYINPKYDKPLPGSVDNVLDTVPDTNPKNSYGVWADSSINNIFGSDDGDDPPYNAVLNTHSKDIYTRRKSKSPAAREEAKLIIQNAIDEIQNSTTGLRKDYDAAYAAWSQFKNGTAATDQPAINAAATRDHTAWTTKAAEAQNALEPYKTALKAIDVRLVDPTTTVKEGALWEAAAANNVVNEHKKRISDTEDDIVEANSYKTQLNNHIAIMEGSKTMSGGSPYDPELFDFPNNRNVPGATRWAPHLLPLATEHLKAFPEFSIYEMGQEITKLTKKLDETPDKEGTFQTNYKAAKAAYDDIRGYKDANDVWVKKNNYPDGYGQKKWWKDKDSDPPDKSQKPPIRLGPDGSGTDNAWHGQWYDKHWHEQVQQSSQTASQLALDDCKRHLDDIILGGQNQTVNPDNRFHFLTTTDWNAATIVDATKRDKVYSCQKHDSKDKKSAPKTLYTQRLEDTYPPPTWYSVAQPSKDRIGVVVLKWNTPADQNWTPGIQSYEINRREGLNGVWQSVTFPTNEPRGESANNGRRKITDYGPFVLNSTYYYKIRSKNSNGFGAWSDDGGVEKFIKVEIYPPDKPENVKIDRETAYEADGRLRVFWTSDPNHYNNNATHFKLQRSAIGKDGPWTTVVILANAENLKGDEGTSVVSPLDYEYIDSDLDNNQKYWYLVSVKDVNKDTRYSDPTLSKHSSKSDQRYRTAYNASRATPQNPAETYIVHDNVNGYITVKWDKVANVTNGGGSLYKVRRSVVGIDNSEVTIGTDGMHSSGTNDRRQVEDTNGGAGFMNGVQLQYSIVAYNNSGDSKEAPKTVNVTAITDVSVPTGFKKVLYTFPYRKGKVKLTWDESTSGPTITNYEVHRKPPTQSLFSLHETLDTTWITANTSSGTITYEDGTITNDHDAQYTYKIRAKHGLNTEWSEFTSEVDATVDATDSSAPGVITGHTAQFVEGQDKILLEWTKPTVIGGNGVVDEYLVKRGKDLNDDNIIDDSEWEPEKSHTEYGSSFDGSGNTKKLWDTDLLNGVTYEYKVATKNRSGVTAPYSAGARPGTVSLVPPKVDSADVQKVGTINDGVLTIFWKVTDIKATHFKIERKIDTGAFTDITEGAAETFRNWGYGVNLAPGKNYTHVYRDQTRAEFHGLTHTYRISAKNANAGGLIGTEGDWGNDDANLYKTGSKSPDSSDVILPVAPSITVLTKEGDETGTVDLEWTEKQAPTGSKNIIEWFIQRRKIAGASTTAWEPLVSSDRGLRGGKFKASTKKTSDGPGLLHGILYEYRIRSKNDVGDSAWGPGVAHTIDIWPPKIADVTVEKETEQKDGSAIVKWKIDNSSEDPTHFKIFRHRANLLGTLLTYDVYRNNRAYELIKEGPLSDFRVPSGSWDYAWTDGPGLEHDVTYYYLVSAWRAATSWKDDYEPGVKGGSVKVNGIANVKWPKVTKLNVKPVTNTPALEIVFKQPSARYNETNPVTGWRIEYRNSASGEWLSVPTGGTHTVTSGGDNSRYTVRSNGDKKRYKHTALNVNDPMRIARNLGTFSDGQGEYALVDGLTYYYRVAATNAVNPSGTAEEILQILASKTSEWSDIVGAMLQTTSPPGKVQNVKVKHPPAPAQILGPNTTDGNRIKNGGFYVQWTAVDGATNYIIERKIGPNGDWKFVYDTIVENDYDERRLAAGHLLETDHEYFEVGMFTYTVSPGYIDEESSFPYAFSLGPSKIDGEVDFTAREDVLTQHKVYNYDDNKITNIGADQTIDVSKKTRSPRFSAIHYQTFYTDETLEYRKDDTSVVPVNNLGWIDYSFIDYDGEPDDRTFYYRVYARNYDIPVYLDPSLSKLDNVNAIFSAQVGPASNSDSMKYNDNDVRKPKWTDIPAISQGTDNKLSVNWAGKVSKNHGSNLRTNPYTLEVTNLTVAPNQPYEIWGDAARKSNTSYNDPVKHRHGHIIKYEVCAKNYADEERCAWNKQKVWLDTPSKPTFVVNGDYVHTLNWGNLPGGAESVSVFSRLPGGNWTPRVDTLGAKINYGANGTVSFPYGLHQDGVVVEYLLQANSSVDQQGPMTNSDIDTKVVNAYRLKEPAGPKSIQLTNVAIGTSNLGKLRIKITINDPSPNTTPPHTGIIVEQKKLASATGANYPNEQWERLTFTNTTSKTLNVDTNRLALNTLYTFRVCTYNSVGTKTSAWMTHDQTTTTAHKLPAPGSPVSASISYSKPKGKRVLQNAKLSWSSVSGAGGYIIKAPAQNNINVVKNFSVPAGTTTWTDPAIRANGQTISYYIYAYANDDYRTMSQRKGVSYTTSVERPPSLSAINAVGLLAGSERPNNQGRGQKDGRIKITFTDLLSGNQPKGTHYLVRFRTKAPQSNTWSSWKEFFTKKRELITDTLLKNTTVDLAVYLWDGSRQDRYHMSACKGKQFTVQVANKNVDYVRNRQSFGPPLGIPMNATEFHNFGPWYRPYFVRQSPASFNGC